MATRDDPATGAKFQPATNRNDEITDSSARDHPPPPAIASAPPQPTGHAANESESVGGLRALWTRMKILGEVLLGLLIDLAFLIIWAMMQQGAHYVFDWLGKLPEMTETVREVMEKMFDGATLILVAAWVARDLWLSIRRVWRTK